MIKAHVADAAALAARTPAQLAAYLRSRGWQLASRTGSSSIWTLPVGDDEFEILVPLDPALRDYAARVRDAVAVLAVAEGRSELEILRLISDTSMDVHTVRLFPNDQPPGMISLDDGVLALESLRGLVSAAAYTVFATVQRAVQPARKPQGLSDYLRTVHIGPAAEGSYLLSVHTQVPPRLSPEQGSLFAELDTESPGSEPVERRISVRIYEAVHAAHEAAEEALLAADGLDGFTQAVSEGVSANLCEALSGLGGAGQHPFELSLSLAAVRPGTSNLPPVRFRNDHLSVLAEAATELRAITPEEDLTVVGHVIRLHRENEATGEITVVGRVDDQEALRRIWIGLTAADYEAAVRAHEGMREVAVHGSLIRRGTRLVLANPTGFRLLAAD
jgi:hypothetical protein